MNFPNPGPQAALTIQPPIVVEGQTAQACLILSRLERLIGPVNITLSTERTTSTATGTFL